MTDEEVLSGPPRPARRRRIAVAAVAAVAAGAVAYAGTHWPGGHGGPTATSSSPVPVAIDTEDAIVLPSHIAGPDSAMAVLAEFTRTGRRNADGSRTWTLLLRNNSGEDVQLAKPMTVHVAAGLHARIVRAELVERGHALLPGWTISTKAWLRLRVQLRIDCAQVDPATTPFPDIPVAVVMEFIAYQGSAAFVLGPPGAEPTWHSVCR